MTSDREPHLTRRQWLTSAAVIGGTAVAGGSLGGILHHSQGATTASSTSDEPTDDVFFGHVREPFTDHTKLGSPAQSRRMPAILGSRSTHMPPQLMWCARYGSSPTMQHFTQGKGHLLTQNLNSHTPPPASPSLWGSVQNSSTEPVSRICVHPTWRSCRRIASTGSIPHTDKLTCFCLSKVMTPPASPTQPGCTPGKSGLLPSEPGHNMGSAMHGEPIRREPRCVTSWDRSMAHTPHTPKQATNTCGSAIVMGTVMSGQPPSCYAESR